MIVVDENASSVTVLRRIRGWYRGRVCGIRDLLPGAVIKDEMIPRVLARERQPTFVTPNVSDFWLKMAGDRRFCIVCLPAPGDRPDEFSRLLRRTLRLQPFRTRRARMGKVALIAPDGVRLYVEGSQDIRFVPWPVNR